MEEDEWVPRISCQACGDSWPLKATIQHDCTNHYSCPDCDYETVHPNGKEIRCGGHSGIGSDPSHGIAGARGRLTHVSEIVDQVLIDASTTPDDGLNTFQGHLVGISSPSSEVQGAEFTLMVYFCSLTRQRLKERLSGIRGKNSMDGVRSWDTIVTVVLPTM